MIFKLEYKKIIILLIISFIIIMSILWYKKQDINDLIPKKASFVLNVIEWREYNA